MFSFFIEVLKDVQAGLAPISRNEAMDMIERLNGFKLLEGYRGKEGVELLILKDSGKYISIIQEAADFNFQPGQTVKIVMSGGKSRVLPR